MMTTYPLAAKSSGFQGYDQSSPQAPCGPPWMRNFTGYFFEGSKFGGLTRKPSTLSPFAPVNQKDSSGDMATWDRTASLMWVIAPAGFPLFMSVTSTSPAGTSQSGPEHGLVTIRTIPPA